jgi:hypothetical protein
MAYITIVRGRLAQADPSAAMARHNAIVAKLEPATRQMGATGHRAFASAEDPRDFLAIDMWESAEGPQRLMSDPAAAAELASLFEGGPNVTVWEAREGWTSF